MPLDFFAQLRTSFLVAWLTTAIASPWVLKERAPLWVAMIVVTALFLLAVATYLSRRRENWRRLVLRETAFAQRTEPHLWYFSVSTALLGLYVAAHALSQS